MSLFLAHQSLCATCRVRTLVAAKQLARSRAPLPGRWKQVSLFAASRNFHAARRGLQNVERPDTRSAEEFARALEGQIHSLDRRLEDELDGGYGVEDGEAVPMALEEEGNEELESVVQSTPDEVARLARQRFGDSLPEGCLGEEEYKAYERLFGPPIGVVAEADAEELVGYEEVLEEMDEVEDMGTGVLREAKDGSLEEVEFLEELEELDDVEEEVEEEVEEGADGESEVDLLDKQRLQELGYEGLDDKTIADLSALTMDHTQTPESEQDDGQSTWMRTHPLTIANRFSTPEGTVYLPKSTFVDPVSILMSGLSNKHVSDTAHRVFGGPGLPYSASTPKRAMTMPQKAIPLDPYQGRMSEMEADVYTATIMPSVYAATYSIMVETRKRLGSAWLEDLLTREGGPRILDAGGAGAGILAAREVLRAEWERMHDTSDDPDAMTDLAEAGGKTGGESIPVPVGRATVLTGSDTLRQRSSTLLDNTTFLPRLPDYVHASDEQAREKGKFDIIIAPHTLWQLREDHLRKQHVENLWNMLSADGGVLILFEKGVPRGFEMVAGAREMLLDKHISSPGSEDVTQDVSDPASGTVWGTLPKEQGMIIAPCTNHSDCPMYTRGSGVSKGRKDHCHFSQRFIRPPFLQKILGAKDRNHEDVDFSYISVMRGRDLRDADELGLVQGDRATDTAFAGYEHASDDDPAPPHPPQEDESFDPTAPAVPDLTTIYGQTTDPTSGAPHPLCLPRAVLPPIKRQGHVILDVCTPAGTLERWTVPRSFSRQAYRDARKASWGDLWALGAKTRTLRNVRVGRGRDGGDAKGANGAVDVKGRVKNKNKSAKNVVEVGFDADGNIKEEDIKVKVGGRMRQGPKVKGIRDKRDKKGLGNGRRNRKPDDA